MKGVKVFEGYYERASMVGYDQKISFDGTHNSLCFGKTHATSGRDEKVVGTSSAKGKKLADLCHVTLLLCDNESMVDMNATTMNPSSVKYIL